MDQNLEAAAKGIFERAKAIILTPGDEWPKIEAESSTIRDIFMRYVLPLAAIGPLAGLLRSQLFGYGALGFSFRPSLGFSLTSAIIGYALGLGGIFVLSLVADFLAPKFDGQSNRLNAFKMVAYGATASWVAGVFQLIPMLGFFGLLGLYSLYLFYTGATPMMKVPQDKSIAYTAVTVLCAALLFIVIAPITAAVTGMFASSGVPLAGGAGDMGGKLTLPGGATLDSGKLAEMGRQAEAMSNGKATPVEIAKLQALLPASVGAYSRTAVESSGLGKVGSQAEGTYGSGGNSFRLRIIDMSALGAIAGLGAAFGVEENREDADSYERTGTVDGHMQTESWRKSDSSGKFGTMVGSRFMIEAEGKAASIDELKSAVASVDQSALAGLAN